jgi:hypothetical protein
VGGRSVRITLVVLAVFGCGGKVDASSTGTQQEDAGTGGTHPCGSKVDASSAGTEQYTRLRAGDGLDLRVNRDGGPVEIDICFR